MCAVLNSGRRQISGWTASGAALPLSMKGRELCTGESIWIAVMPQTSSMVQQLRSRTPIGPESPDYTAYQLTRCLSQRRPAEADDRGIFARICSNKSLSFHGLRV